jgi:hypothetical protein
MKRMAKFPLPGIGVEVWLVDVDQYDQCLDAFRGADDWHCLDAAAEVCSGVAVLAASWGSCGLPRDEKSLLDWVEDVIPSERDEVAELVRESW